MNFSTRTYESELLDRDDIPFEDIRRNMQELDFINTWLGGHQITLHGLKHFINRKKEISVCEIGCGGGDNLRAIHRWCEKKNLHVSLQGIDINPHCIEVARQSLQNTDHKLISSDYKQVDFKSEKPGVIFSSLFCHHFTDEELVSMLRWMHQQSSVGFFINDLHRHRLAYYSIKYLTKFFSRSYLVKNDAPLSVRRGFSKQEWINLLIAAGIKNYSIKWKWAFRWLIVVRHE